ncbi:MAG: (S)-ureidoglycine aminohydrolase [Deinococcales bacterium]
MLMPHLGESRTVMKARHAFLAPDGHVRTTLPGWHKTSIIMLISPQMGARFQQYLAEMEAGGKAKSAEGGLERFIFVLEGEITIDIDGKNIPLSHYDYAFLPAHSYHSIRANKASKLNVFERRYIPLAGAGTPTVVTGNEKELVGEVFMGDPKLICRKLLPDNPAFDIAVNTMSFEPGVPLPFVETHVMEHGMLMLEGAGIYRLEQDWYPIREGDNLWMGPYCPQWFACIGKTSAKYLLYKENNRDPFVHAKES